MSVISISDLARELGCRPRDISDAFYARFLDETQCPSIAGRRLIPREYVPTIRRVLSERGKLPRTESATP